MKKILTAIIVMVDAACNQDRPKGDIKTMDFGAFSIETPESWKQVKANGTDSYVGRIAIDSNDTLTFDLGWYSNNLAEAEPYLMERSLLQYFQQKGEKVDTSEIIIVESRKGVDMDKFRKQNVMWDIIDKRISKIVYPRKPGYGITGIYIDSLWVRGSDIDRFNQYGENLKPTNEKKVLEVLRTLKFKKNSKV